MAEAYGKLTGRPGICFVTRGPGATHASVGVHTAFQDSTPLILLVGQVASRPGRSARRSRRSTTGTCSGRWRSGSRRSTAPTAFPSTSRARSRPRAPGRPGPVVLALPEDMLAGRGRRRRTRSRSTSCSRIRAPEQIERLRELLDARRAAVRDRSAAAAGRRARAQDLRAFAEANELPVGAAFRCQDASTTTRRATSATSASASTRSSPRASRDADLLLVDRRRGSAR